MQRTRPEIVIFLSSIKSCRKHLNFKVMKINSEVRYAAHPQDVKHYDTEQLRKNYLIEKVFSADEINIVYTMHDRMIAGGAMPVKEVLSSSLSISCVPNIPSKEGKSASSM